MKVLKYLPIPSAQKDSELERRIQQLAVLARALANEVEILRAELSNDPPQPRQINLDEDSIDFYEEVERYEIELIESALHQCNGNQAHAARLLQMKSTTLNAKMKHYGLNPVRSIMLQRAK